MTLVEHVAASIELAEDGPRRLEMLRKEEKALLETRRRINAESSSALEEGQRRRQVDAALERVQRRKADVKKEMKAEAKATR